VRVFLTALAATAIFAAPAYAQGKSEAPPDPVALQKKRQAEEADRAYNAAIKNAGPTRPAQPADPWANARTPAPAK
jgi:hypothetical protein